MAEIMTNSRAEFLGTESGPAADRKNSPPVDIDTTHPRVTIGQQPIILTAIVAVLMIVGIGGVFAWRSYSGASPEPERLTASRLQQARVAQASEQLVEKTKGIEATQQQSIDQLQVVQDQLQTMQRLMTSQQTETRKLSEQVGALTTTLDNIQQSFASTSANDNAPAAREQPRRQRSRATVSRARPKPAAAPRKRPAARS